MQEVHDYGINFWSNNEFKIEKGLVKVCHGKNPSLLEIVQSVRDKGYRGPLLVRFPHLVQKQIKSLFDAFSLAIKEYQYSGAFKAVFPLKVNQMPSFVLPLVQGAKGLDYGFRGRE